MSGRSINMSGITTDAGDDSELDLDLDPESDFDLERTELGGFVCPGPNCCAIRKTADDIIHHRARVHGGSIASNIVGEETWRAYLRAEHVDRQRSASEIAATLPKHVAAKRVTVDLKEFGLHDPDVASRSSKIGPSRLLEQADSIEEARQLAANGGLDQ